MIRAQSRAVNEPINLRHCGDIDCSADLVPQSNQPAVEGRHGRRYPTFCVMRSRTTPGRLHIHRNR